MTTVNFGQAIEVLKQGGRVAREGWNGKGMFLFYVDRPESYWGCEGLNWIGMKTADNKVVPWLASQTDILAEDWTIVEKH